MAALSQTPANVASGTGARQSTVTGGATVAAGMPVYKDVADSNQYKPCKADAVATASCNGIALNSGADNQPLVIQAAGRINLGATLVVGMVYCVSDAVLGEIVPYTDLGSGDYVTILGVAVSTSELELNIINSAVAKP